MGCFSVVLKTNTEEKLACLNHANQKIADPIEHHMWCSKELPFGETLHQFPPGTEPVACWAALNEQGEQVAHAELHHVSFGWILARLWVDERFRNKGLARKIWMKALDYAFQHTDSAGCFCDLRNTASKKLQLSMGFQVVKVLPELGAEYFKIDRATYTRLKRSGRGKLSLAFARPPKTNSVKTNSGKLSSQRRT